MARWVNSRPTHVPATLRKACLDRDGRQCTAPMRDGTRCPTTTTLEAHHIDGWQIGQVTTLEQLVTLCHWHHEKITQQQAAEARRKNPAPQKRRAERHPGLL